MTSPATRRSAASPTRIVTSRLRIGTRGSPLALVQARAVASLIVERTGVACDLAIIRTSGDRLAEASLSEVGGKRLFVKEIEDALLDGLVDVAVHSSKDMPADLPDGLEIAAVLPREDPADALVLPGQDAAGLSFDDVRARLGPSPRIGTSSVRRVAQLSRLFPGATFLPIRGNVDTRLAKLDAGEFDVIVLAAAGLRRLERHGRISASVPVEACVPAPGQGIVAIEIRSQDERVGRVVTAIDDVTARAALAAERAVVTRLGGGCQMPIGAYASVTTTPTGTILSIHAVVASLDGSRMVTSSIQGTLADPAAAGRAAAERLLEQGAGAILAEVRENDVDG